MHLVSSSVWRHIIWAGAIALGLAGTTACGDGETTPDAGVDAAADAGAACTGPNGPCIEVAPGADDQTAVQTALIEAQPGDIILFRAGTYTFDRALSLDVDDVTIRGEGMDMTIFSFAGQTQGAQGLLVTAGGFTIEDLAIEDTAGDGLKIEGGDGVTIRRVRVEWTGGPSADNGAYGLYPVQCSNVLIEDSVVKGASDAGIYVGQSDTIVIRGNVAQNNVAGIEIENSSNADVHDNTAMNNTGGLLIFNLPGLPVQNGAVTRAFDNVIAENNTANFAPPGNIVGLVPRGTGVLIMAGHQIELFGNEIRDNETANLAIMSYLVTQIPIDDPAYDPYVDTIHVHDNVFTGGGDNADAPAGSLGEAVVGALSTIMDQPIVVPDIIFFGFVNPDKAAVGDPAVLAPEYNLCIRLNGDANFANLDAPGSFAAVSTDVAPHDCEHPALPAVTLPGA